jgi:hypothetical protein
VSVTIMVWLPSTAEAVWFVVEQQGAALQTQSNALLQSPLLADTVVKVFLRHLIQIFRAVHAAIEQ